MTTATAAAPALQDARAAYVRTRFLETYAQSIATLGKDPADDEAEMRYGFREDFAHELSLLAAIKTASYWEEEIPGLTMVLRAMSQMAGHDYVEDLRWTGSAAELFDTATDVLRS